MGGRIIGFSAALLAALALVVGPSWSQDAKKAPDKSTVEVTYYYLPG